MNNKERENNEIRQNILNWGRLFLGEDCVNENIDKINSIIDDIIDDELTCFGDTNKEDSRKEIVDTAVNTMKREQEKCNICNEDDKAFEDFSNKVTAKESLQIHKIISEYVDTVIKPRVKKVGYNNNNDVVDSVYEALYEFACWMLLK